MQIGSTYSMHQTPSSLSQIIFPEHMLRIYRNQWAAGSGPLLLPAWFKFSTIIWLTASRFQAVRYKTLKFVQIDKDIFSIENYLVHINKKIEMKKNINFVTNSDNLVFELLLRTDIATIGIDLKYSEYNNDAIKRLEIKDQLENVSIGFIKRKGENITSEAFKFIELLKTKI